ncbi:ribonuclease J [Sphingomicrobium astaxanthinifaciens]|uniref:ribonuclease J n=1 Tax=Sphingomicrobium astaxanthinifaciens TaxID=1227949 RepID=UPI001FCB764E|nr:ribonuclease J [Sphingomicrobium astaxanthinifaciens]MCJ7422165.1 ribonuclease J [Sphingomicrobium astaxanthinifaciens]
MSPQDELLFLALGGSGEIGMNVNLYGCRGKWLMVDLGLTFADPYYPGVDLILPDLEFIEERQEELVGIVLTHGHEDHIGAIPYLADELKVPLYATPFTAGLIREKLEAEGLIGQLDLRVIERDGEIELDPFKVRFVALSHSIPEGNGVLIDSPYGKVFHTGDWKIDETPVLGTPTGDAAMHAIGDEGVLALVCDSTNVFDDKPSGSEQGVHDGLLEAVRAASGRVLVTTFASNAARLETLGRIARETGREICVAGRSLDRIIRVAQSTGYLEDFPTPVRFDEAMRLPREKLLIIATGGQGEPRAALARIATGNHDLKLTRGDTVVFSSKQIPGNEIAIGRIMNALSDLDISIVTEKQAHVHVSGHPGRPELKQMYEWIRPHVLVPVHGENRHMREQAKLGRECGIPHAVFQVNGEVVRLAPGKPETVDHVRTGRLVLDGDVILPADGETMNKRRKLAFNGVIAVALGLDAKGGLRGTPEVRALGVPVEADAEDFLADLADSAMKAFAPGRDMDKALEKVRIAVRRCAFAWTGKKPIVEVMAVDA